MVHFYDEMTEQELFNIVTAEPGDVEAVVSAVTSWLTAHPDRVAEAE